MAKKINSQNINIKELYFINKNNFIYRIFFGNSLRRAR